MTIKPWKVISSKYLVQDKWLTLRADTCESGDGVTIDPFYILEKKDWAHIVALNTDNQILIVRQYRHGAQAVTAEIPCGIIDETDTTPLDAAKRELLEETGCVANDWQFSYSAYANPARQTNRIHCFSARSAVQIADPDLDDTEEIESEFIDLKSLYHLIKSGEFSQILHIASVYHTLAKMGLLHLMMD